MRKNATWSPCSFRLIATIAAFTAMSALPALAGPPFITDDPEPVDLHHWEVYAFSAATQVKGDFGGTLAGTEVNYGAAPNLQLHVIVPLAFDAPSGGPTQTGVGDIELGAKYRFIDKDGLQIGMFPLLEVPTGDPKLALGSGYAREYIPIWVQEDFGRWTTYGGGGYWINPGPGNQNYWFAGWLLQRQVTDNLALGAEIFHQTADTIGGRDTTGFNAGGIFDFTDHYHLLFSAGRGLQHAQDANEFSYYLAIQWTS
ncbi:MAG: hypothetical protein KGJ53_01520 [Alphaproteobacteria bacterium]|nr:hypothetical protein [Alphaproteobacteria bacterium]MDE2161814.1 hypothetical protein [Alphaproteobacteria bacterium]